jgi:hypothetical protein
VGIALLLQIVHGHVGGGGSCTARLSLLLVTPLNPAEIIVLPTARPVANPVLLIVASVVFDELQLTCVVMSCTLLS